MLRFNRITLSFRWQPVWLSCTNIYLPPSFIRSLNENRTEYRVTIDCQRNFITYFVTGKDVISWKNACLGGTRNYRSETLLSLLSLVKYITSIVCDIYICIYFVPLNRCHHRCHHQYHHHHAVNICQRYYDRATLYFLESTF